MKIYCEEIIDIKTDKIFDFLRSRNPVFEFISYYKYVFTYKNDNYYIMALNNGHSDDIYKMILSNKMTFIALLDNGFNFYSDDVLLVGEEF